MICERKEETDYDEMCIRDSLLVEGKNYFLMEHEQYGKDVAYVVLDQNGNVLVAVSYTHLDVYKRQERHLSALW